jgi:hypothetical protein
MKWTGYRVDFLVPDTLSASEYAKKTMPFITTHSIPVV